MKLHLTQIVDINNVNFRIHTGNNMKSFSILAKVFLLTLLLVGCSQIGLFYDYTDWYIEYKIDSYFDINDDQEDFLEIKVDQLHAWHRKEEIPRIVTFLKQVKVEVQNGFSEENLPWIENEYTEMRIRVHEKAGDDIALFLSSLTTEQINYFQKQLEENRERRRKRLRKSDEEWLKDRKEKVIEQLEDWYGDLTKNQESKVLANVKFVRHDRSKHDEQNIETQKRIIQLLHEKKTTEEIKIYITAWFMNPSVFSSPDNEEEIEKRKVTWMDYWIKLNDILTQKQKQHALDKLQGYIDDLEDIHNNT
mgnify:CR=1 FL=1